MRASPLLLQRAGPKSSYAPRTKPLSRHEGMNAFSTTFFEREHHMREYQSRHAASLKYCVTGSSLALGLRGVVPDEQVLLVNTKDASAPQVEGVSKVVAMLKVLEATAAKGGKVFFRDVALVKLALVHLAPVVDGLVAASAAISTIAKNIDFAAADEWGRASGCAYRKEQLEWIEEMHSTNEDTRDYIRDVAFETKVPFAADMDDKKHSSLLQAALEWTVESPASSQQQRTHAEPSASLFVGEPGNAAGESREPQSVLEVKEKLFAMMSRCVAPPKERFGFEVNGLLGAPDTTYRCLLCDTKPLLQMDLLLHAESRGHRLASEQCTAAARAEEDAFLHALRMQQALSWEDSVQAQEVKRTPGYLHPSARDAARERAEMQAPAS